MLKNTPVSNPLFVALACGLLLLGAASVSARVYSVGPGRTYANISDVPLDTLDPGDRVEIHFRKTPYRETLVIKRSGTRQLPIVITGVREGGRLPVIDGVNAEQTRDQLPRHFGRSLITIGDETPGDYVVIKDLILQNANNSESYTVDGVQEAYKANAAGIFLWRGRHVTVTGCRIHDCGDGILTNSAPEVEHFTLRNAILYHNGNRRHRNSTQEHNVYLQGRFTIVEFCRFGPPFSDGHVVKDRGFHTIIRYNWLEGGWSRQMDLVENSKYQGADAYVYGNVIVQGDKARNRQMIHWGGEEGSRSGKLHFFNNTVIGKTHDTAFVFNHQADCGIVLTNNVFTGVGQLWNGVGSFFAQNNWISRGILVPNNLSVGLRGDNPGFMWARGIPYIPQTGSPLTNTGSDNMKYWVKFMPKPTGGGYRRPNFGPIDIGAFEAGAFWFQPAGEK